MFFYHKTNTSRKDPANRPPRWMDSVAQANQSFFRFHSNLRAYCTVCGVQMIDIVRSLHDDGIRIGQNYIGMIKRGERIAPSSVYYGFFTTKLEIEDWRLYVPGFEQWITEAYLSGKYIVPESIKPCCRLRVHYNGIIVEVYKTGRLFLKHSRLKPDSKFIVRGGKIVSYDHVNKYIEVEAYSPEQLAIEAKEKIAAGKRARALKGKRTGAGKRVMKVKKADSIPLTKKKRADGEKASPLPGQSTEQSSIDTLQDSNVNPVLPTVAVESFALPPPAGPDQK